MNRPKFSIITPSFNQGDFLEETILSVLEQNYPALEYIIIDGGSNDRSKEIIRKYEKHLAYWVSEKDNGQSHAINKGFKKATGSLVSWLCSDDLYTPGTLNKVAGIFQDDPAAGMLHGKTVLFNSKGKENIKGATEDDLALKYFAVIPFPQPSSFFRKEVLDTVGLLDESLHFGMDYELLIRIALKYKILRVDDIFSRYRLHDDSKTVSQQARFGDEWLKIFCRFLLSVKQNYGLTELLRSANVFHDDGVRYEIDRNFTEKELRLITSYFLYYQLVIYNDLLQKEHCRKLIDLIGTIDTDFYRAHNLKSIEFKIRFIPSPLISFLRKLMR